MVILPIVPIRNGEGTYCYQDELLRKEEPESVELKHGYSEIMDDNQVLLVGFCDQQNEIASDCEYPLLISRE